MSSRLSSIEISVAKNGFLSTVRILYLYVLFKYLRKTSFLFKREKINLRSGTSDFSVFREVFMEHEYDLEWKKEEMVIVDLGANIGMSTLYFSKYYPNSTIYAIEADNENYSVLLENIKGKKGIIALHNAIWKDNSPVFIEKTSSHWARSVTSNQTEGSAVLGITLGSLFTDYKITKIDILKIDIEGSEIQLFQYLKANNDLLKKINTIVVETHDWMTPGCSKAIFDCLSETQYNLSISGEKFLIKLYN
jgi:FkbM family methyltransferase